MIEQYKCITDCRKYVDKINDEYNGCGGEFKLIHGLFPFFNHLDTFFPHVYQHMMKELKIE